MPQYSWHCEAGHEFDRYYALADYVPTPRCECGALASRVYKPVTIIGPRDISYTSPIDGRPITSEAARRDDLERNNCQPYDPEMKTDYLRRNAAAEAALDRSIETTVGREIATMPSDKRERLHNELRSNEVAVERRTAPDKPMKVKTHV